MRILDSYNLWWRHYPNKKILIMWFENQRKFIVMLWYTHNTHNKVWSGIICTTIISYIICLPPDALFVSLRNVCQIFIPNIQFPLCPYNKSQTELTTVSHTRAHMIDIGSLHNAQDTMNVGINNSYIITCCVLPWLPALKITDRLTDRLLTVSLEARARSAG